MKSYFAYGTLLDVPSMHPFAPSAEPLRLMRLDGYQMDFAETRQRVRGMLAEARRRSRCLGTAIPA